MFKTNTNSDFVALLYKLYYNNIIILSSSLCFAPASAERVPFPWSKPESIIRD